MGCEQSRLDQKRMATVIEPARKDVVISRTHEPSSNQSSYQAVQKLPQAEMDPVKLEELLQDYRECEDNIRALEKEDPLTLYYIKKSHAESISEAILAAGQKLENLSKAMQGELGREKNLKKVVVDYGNKGTVSKAEQEFLTTANRLEIISTEMEMLQQEKALVESDASAYKNICSKLAEFYNRQDEISKNLIITATTPEELEMLKELAEKETKKIKISETFQRWKEARLLVIEACRQFSIAIKKWKEISDDTPANLYDTAEEVRDDLVTALQAILNATFYIKSDLPYCSKPEMMVLEKAMSYVFIDMNTSERRQHADSCYSAFQNRAVALFAWIDVTIKKVIEPDLRKACEDLNESICKLKDIRFHTIKEQFPNVTWKTNEEVELEPSDNDLITLSDQESKKIYSQLDQSQLAQPPPNDRIYGKFTVTTDYKSMLKYSANGNSYPNVTRNGSSNTMHV